MKGNGKNRLTSLKALPDNACDLILTAAHEKRATLKTWTECARILKPGGNALVLCRNSVDIFWRICRDMDAAGLRIAAKPLFWYRKGGGGGEGEGEGEGGTTVLRNLFLGTRFNGQAKGEYGLIAWAKGERVVHSQRMRTAIAEFGPFNPIFADSADSADSAEGLFSGKKMSHIYAALLGLFLGKVDVDAGEGMVLDPFNKSLTIKKSIANYGAINLYRDASRRQRAEELSRFDG